MRGPRPGKSGKRKPREARNRRRWQKLWLGGLIGLAVGLVMIGGAGAQRRRIRVFKEPDTIRLGEIPKETFEDVVRTALGIWGGEQRMLEMLSGIPFELPEAVGAEQEAIEERGLPVGSGEAVVIYEVGESQLRARKEKQDGFPDERPFDRERVRAQKTEQLWAGAAREKALRRWRKEDREIGVEIDVSRNEQFSFSDTPFARE